MKLVAISGKAYKLDTAVIIGGGKRAVQLMPFRVFCTLHGVTKSEQPEEFKRLAEEYDKVHKPAFRAKANAALDLMRKKMDIRSVGLRQLANGNVSGTARFLAELPKQPAIATEAGKAISSGKAKQDKQSKAKAKRHAKAKAKTELNPVAPAMEQAQLAIESK